MLRIVSGRRVGLLLLGFLTAAAAVLPAAAQEDHAQGRETEMEERARLFVALLKRRAERILESRRAPPLPVVSGYSGVSCGSETNVNLDGSRKGDLFLEQSAGVTFRPLRKGWINGELAYDFLGTEFAEFTDSNLWSHTFSGLFKIQPIRQWQVDLGADTAVLNFPLDTDNSFFDTRFKVFGSFAQWSWLTHRAGWTFQQREYDTRRARDADQVKLAGLSREDKRHTASYELRMRFQRCFARVGAEFYRNFSNDQFQEFYDWEDLRAKGLLTWIFNPRWTGTFTLSHERKNYQSRSVPAIVVAQRDNLVTAAASLVYEVRENVSATYSLTYRHQDSNDPRLDFTDWIHQLGLTVNF
ncbi:MAG: hypothetical protein HYZ88_03040 [Candidatus Omnitrophica bacterium]|nr:hypothetical protein [Candidatus Omnitrophota bacterium]